MKLFSLLLASLLLQQFLYAQQTPLINNTLIGYQEFPTSIMSHSFDAAGNQYYTGLFRGQLTTNNKVWATGNGLEDFFWIKTDANGQIMKVKTYGTPNMENCYTNSLAVGTSNMLFGFSALEPVQLGNQTFVPYQYTNSSFASALVCTDTAGTIRWVRKTNLQNFRIVFANNVYHVLGPVMTPSPATWFEDRVVLDSIGRNGFIHLMLDTNGQLLGAKSITARNQQQGVTLMNTGSFSDKSLFLQFSVGGDSAFYINQNLVTIPPVTGSYQTFLKIDSGYQNFRYKVLNPQRHSITGYGNSMFPSTVATDSIYASFAIEGSNTAPFYLDGVLQTPLRNNLYVFDSTLTLQRQVYLGPSQVGTYPNNTYRRRVFFRQMLVQNGQVFLNGVFTGINESPMKTIATKDTVISIFPHTTSIIDQNGPSKSFMAKISLNAKQGSLTWYGSHSEYENINVSPAFLHPAGSQRMAFHQPIDNVWNPWIVDENLNIITGSMRKNADLPETPQMIKFFADGSRLVLGYARGRTAFDSTSNFMSNISRRDLFLVRLRPNNQVAWYKRVSSTLSSPDIRCLELRNGKMFFLVNYLGLQNDSNYIRVDSSIFNVRVNASLLASVDTAGNINVLNLTNPLLRTVFLMNAGFFSNGDLVVATDVNPVAYQGFPADFSPQLFRLNATTGAILSGRKLLGANAVFYTLQVDNNDQLYLSGSTNTLSDTKLYLHNGAAFVSLLPVVAGNTNQPTLLKMSWDNLQWLKRFSGNALIKQLGDLALVNNKPVMGVASGIGNTPLLFEGQTVHNGVSAMTFSFVGLDAEGKMLYKKVLENTMVNYMRSGSNNNLYATGLMRMPMKIDTIQIGFDGMIDALALVLDSNLTAKRSFRVASPYSESMTDMDIFQDTVVALAYTAQGNPQVSLNRQMIVTSDYQQDAYLGLINTRTTVITAVNDPLPPATNVSVTPNPVTNHLLTLTVQTTAPLQSSCIVYSSDGRRITSKEIQLSSGTNYYQIALPSGTGKGVYHLIISNKKWTTTRTFIVL